MSESLNIVLCIVLIAVLLIWADDVIDTHVQYQTEAIERGYAIYCPQDGKFSWVGECDLVESN